MFPTDPHGDHRRFALRWQLACGLPAGSGGVRVYASARDYFRVDRQAFSPGAVAHDGEVVETDELFPPAPRAGGDQRGA